VQPSNVGITIDKKSQREPSLRFCIEQTPEPVRM
jgi:hypothetical protein